MPASRSPTEGTSGAEATTGYSAQVGPLALAKAAAEGVDVVDDRAPRCRVVVAEDSYRARQGTEFSTGISAQSVGATGICLHLSVIPPGSRAKAHLHAGHETAIYVIEGAVDTWYGESLEECVTARTGEFIYIPAGTPHLPVNRSQTRPLTVVLARTDPNEQESVVLLPDLDERVGPSGSIPS